ncbi:AraC family transcriptional regulator [Marinomonas transparens]|uniref:AraC family transcriptional regulator n=1 Tax=Marinomonas transparens TaxID=2795388 RepID=A0A934N2I3_9GAMM|nr:AraC family transcriptional regulator [Marinomonas transparens]MBJ7538792.1 AraC family transcriptional regulator [Marinomonas transparens]
MSINATFRYQHIEELPGLVVSEAALTQFSFQPHFHLGYHIGLVTQGVLHQTWNNQKYHLTAGQICLMPPGVVHHGTGQGEDIYHLTTFRVTPERLNSSFFDCEYRGTGHQLAPIVIEQASLAQSFIQLKNLFASNNEADQLHRDSLWTSNMAELLRIAEKKPQQEENYGLSKQQLTTIRDYCEANLHNKISLNQLATLSGLTRFQFIRRFQKQTGLAPHAWLTCLRLERACASLTSPNAMIADIAADMGFYDQSHFNRVFKTAYQVAPSQYRLQA